MHRGEACKVPKGAPSHFSRVLYRNRGCPTLYGTSGQKSVKAMELGKGFLLSQVPELKQNSEMQTGPKPHLLSSLWYPYLCVFSRGGQQGSKERGHKAEAPGHK